MLAALTLAGSATTGLAAAPAPPNPSDEELEAGRAEADSAAARVGTLANRVAEADAQLLALQDQVSLAHEETNRALLELQLAQDEAAAAQAAADAAQAAADAAGARIRDMQRRIDEFAAGSYRQHSTIGSVTAFLGSDSPEDLLARAELLESISGSQLDALEDMQRARTVKANKDSTARAALADARAKQQLAEQAKVAADEAYQSAIDAENAQAGRAAQLQDRKADLERQLYEARQAVQGLEGQRQRYEEWKAEREREQAAAAAAAAATESSSSSGSDSDSDSGSSASTEPAGGSVEAVIDRARSQLGVRYSWGGGDADGPTVGIRDGGVADSYGDYRNVGFDCSGLMIYAFAPAIGYSLPHYSGAQYDSGTRVPLSQKQPGDMLFWATDGRIHHVALYIGDGMMIEAPYSGGEVRIAPVRTSGIKSYAVRIL
ncbi:MAG: hydrolase [Pseudonocardiaceae bacterium]|nr:hydrolase [Pseudonocardiaceae bacterium]